MKLGGNIVVTYVNGISKFGYDEMNISDVNITLHIFCIPVN